MTNFTNIPIPACVWFQWTLEASGISDKLMWDLTSSVGQTLAVIIPARTVFTVT